MLELALDAGHGLSLVPTPWSGDRRKDERHPEPSRARRRASYGGGRGRGMNGTHRGDGHLHRLRTRRPRGFSPPARLAAVAPWLARVMGLAWAADGAGDGPRRAGDVPRGTVAYAEEEEAMVAERLRALGYLE